MSLPLHERVSVMETKIDQAENILEDHEKRLRYSEKHIYIAMGGLAVLQIILKFIHI